MASSEKILALQELSKRGKLSPQRQAAFEELMRRQSTPSEAAPSAEEPQGFVQKNLLSGQLPLVGTALGGAAGALLGLPAAPLSAGVSSAVGGVAGAGLGAAGGQSLENVLKNLLGAGGPKTIGEGFESAGVAGIEGAAAQALPLGKLLSLPGKLAGSAVRASGISQPLKKAGEFIAERAIPAAKRSDILLGVRGGVKPVGIRAAERGIVGTKRQIQKTAQEGVEKFGNLIDEALSGRSETIDPRIAVKSLDDLRTTFSRSGESKLVSKLDSKVADFIKNNTAQGEAMLIKAGPGGKIIGPGASTLDVSEANQIKRSFQKIAERLFGKSTDETAAFKKSFAKNLSRGIRQEIERVVPKAQIGKLNENAKFFIELNDAIAESLAKDLTGGSFRQLAISGGRQFAGAGVGGLVGGLPGAVAGQALQIGVQSLPVKTFLAAQLLKKPGENVAQEFLLHPTFRKAIFKGLNTALKFKGISEAKGEAPFGVGL